MLEPVEVKGAVADTLNEGVFTLGAPDRICDTTEMLAEGLH
jgi:hypothetical protein